MRAMYLIDGVRVPRVTAVRAIMVSWRLNYAEAGDLLDIRNAAQCREGLVVKHVFREEW